MDKKNRKYFVIGIVLCFFSFFSLKNYLNVPRKPNIILITIDALRADHLGCYGYQRNTSPHIDALAKEGILITQAISQFPETQSSVASYLTSHYPSMHYRDYEQDRNYINPHTPTLAKILRKAGYYTGLITDFYAINQVFRIIDIKNEFNECYQTSPNDPQLLTQEALQWLKANKNKKFFLYLHYFGVHAPYVPSLPYSAEFLRDNYNGMDEDVPIATEKDIRLQFFGFIPSAAAEKNITSANYYRCQYDGKIRVVDEQMGLFFEGLKKLGLDKNTLVVLIADHGESLGEHNFYFQHNNLFESNLRVPLIIIYEGALPKNKIIDRQVQLLDIAPTILDIAGVKNYDYKRMEGQDLACLILGGKNCAERNFAFGMRHHQLAYFLRTKKWKLVYFDLQKGKQLYPGLEIFRVLEGKTGEEGSFAYGYYLCNLESDPQERYNLAEKNLKVFMSLKIPLDQFIKKSEKEASNAKKDADKYLKIYADQPLQETEREKLKSLGYAQ